MPLHIGNTNIGAIYKGTTPISSIYKGTTLVYTSFSWKEWYNEYIYNAIIPTTLPKNLFDGEWQKGAWVNGSYVSSADGVASVNYISVKPNTTYYFNLNLYVCEFDANKTFIQRDTDQTQITTTSNTYFLQFNTRSSYGNVYKNDIAIYNKSLLVQDKAKLVEIQGNSCVVNQLLQNGNFENGLTNWSTEGLINTSVANGVLTGTLSQNAFRVNQIINFVANHDYLFSFEIELVSTSGTNNRYVGIADSNDYLPSAFIQIKELGNTLGKNKCFIISRPTTSGTSTLRAVRGLNFVSGDVIKISNVQTIDLTKQFPFDTPTTLTDNCVKRIIEQGYIPFNSGEIKDSIVGEVVANGYNLFDGEIELGWINSAGGLTTDTNTWRSKNYTQVVGGFEYTLSSALSGYTNMYVYQYDKDKTLIKYSGSIGSTSIPSYNITLENETKYIKFAYYKNGANFTNNLPPLSETQLCLHRAGTRTGYADYLPQQYLPSEYQEVEYLESTGTQYIDTGLTINQNSRIKITYQYNADTGTATRVFGYGDNNGSGYIISTRTSSIASAIQTLFGGGWLPSSGNVIPQTDKIVLEQIANNQYVNGSLYYEMSSPTTFTTSSNVIVFGASNRGTLGLSKVRIYGLSIWQNGTDLSRNFIPCYRKSDNVAGLYDLVNNLFYANNGTGTFIVGKKVNNNTMIKLPAPLDLGGARNSHNKFEITKTEYVFTRDMWNYTFSGSETIGYNSSNKSFYVIISSSVAPLSMFVGVSTTANALFDGAPTYWRNKFTNDLTLPLGLARVDITNANRWEIRNLTYDDTTISGFTSWLTGKTIHYQLATPQVIRIPRKHLGCVDLGTLSYTSNNTYGCYSSSLSTLAKKPTSNSLIANIFCSKYLTTYRSAFDNGSSLYICIDSSRDLDIQDASLKGLTNAQIQAKLSGIYLFYETQDEVQDFNDEMFIQSGGTITTDSEVLPNITLGVKCK